jgi:hypothetical protein
MVQEFERITGYKVVRSHVNQDTNDERYIVEFEIGGWDADEEAFYELVLEGPAQGEKGYL